MPGSAERLSDIVRLSRDAATPPTGTDAASVASRQHAVDLFVARRHVIEHVMEIACERAQVFRKRFRIENFRKPPQTNQSIDRGRKIDPAERHFWREVDAA